MISGTVAFVAISAVKISTLLGCGLGISNVLEKFHSYKPKAKRKEEYSDEGESLREKARRLQQF